LIQRVIMARGTSPRSNTTLSGQRGDRGVIALIGDRHDINKFAQGLADAGAGSVLWIGTSSGRPDVAASFREAAACSRLARQASPYSSRVIHGSALGPLRFMLDIRDLTNARAFVQEVLGPVAAHEEAGGAQLLTTLRAYVEEDGHHQRIAERCHIHVSTVKYRLARIASLMDRPLQPWQTRFEITLAFRLADLLQSVPGNGSSSP
jgi:DNA-binding PucR family transcriptional regulator